MDMAVRVQGAASRSTNHTRGTSVFRAQNAPRARNMNIATSIPSGVASISFYSLSPEETRRISVRQIVNPVLLDDLNRPNPGGLYDPALGPSGTKDM